MPAQGQAVVCHAMSMLCPCRGAAPPCPPCLQWHPAMPFAAHTFPGLIVLLPTVAKRTACLDPLYILPPLATNTRTHRPVPLAEYAYKIYYVYKAYNAFRLHIPPPLFHRHLRPLRTSTAPASASIRISRRPFFCFILLFFLFFLVFSWQVIFIRDVITGLPLLSVSLHSPQARDTL